MSDLELGLIQTNVPAAMQPGQEEKEFLWLYCRSSDNDFAFFNEWQEYLSHLSSLMGEEAIGVFRSTLEPTFCGTYSDYQVMIRAFCAAITILREDPRISVSRLCDRLAERRVVKKTTTESTARYCVLSLVGWSSLLFIPSRKIINGDFLLDTQGAKCFGRSSVAIQQAGRPIHELLRSFGELLPKKKQTMGSLDGMQSTESAAYKFYVSNVNVAALSKLGNIEIIWVDTVSAHLDFDPTGPSLRLFKLPSYCRLHASDDTFLSIITREFYMEGEEPIDNFVYRDLMEEIIKSYGLLFSEWRSARILYRRKERKKAVIKDRDRKGRVDPFLDKLCGFDRSTSMFASLFSSGGVREVYDARADFPILSPKLKSIQIYMEGIQPGRASSMWHDRRDLRLWYTIWVVLIIGGISIIQSSISIVISGAQLGMAYRSYDLQKQQGG